MALMIALLAACGSSEESSDGQTAGTVAEPLKIQLAHSDTESEDGIHQKMAMLFADYVSELSGGTMEIEIVGNGQLGGERDLVEGMRLGTIQMASTANMVLSNFDPRFAVLDLPYLIMDYETAYAVLDSEEIQNLDHCFRYRRRCGIRCFYRTDGDDCGSRIQPV